MCLNKQIKIFIALLLCALQNAKLCAQSTETIRHMRIKSQEIQQKELKNGSWKVIRYSKTFFDRKGNIESNIEFGIDSVFKSNQKIIYNSNHDPVEDIILDEFGKQIKKTQIIYNRLDQKEEERIFDANNELKSVTKFEFDQFGHKILEIEMDANQTEVSRIIYAYNKYGSLVFKQIFEGGKCIYEKKYEYQYY